MTLGNHEPDFAAARPASVTSPKRAFPMLAANVTLQAYGQAPGRAVHRPRSRRREGRHPRPCVPLHRPDHGEEERRRLAFERDSAEVVSDSCRGCARPARRSSWSCPTSVWAPTKAGRSRPRDRRHRRRPQPQPHERGAASRRHAHRPGGAHGSDLGRLDLSQETASHRAPATAHHARPRDVAAGRREARLLESIVAPLRPKLDERLGEATAPIVRAQTLAGQEARKRDEQSPADSLFADILREETKCDVALLPGVGYGVAIPRGPITAAMLRNLVPHESKSSRSRSPARSSGRSWNRRSRTPTRTTRSAKSAA